MKRALLLIVAILCLAESVSAQTVVSVSSTVTFAASPDHATVVANYQVVIRPAGGGTSVFNRMIGKPTPSTNGSITVPIGWTVAEFGAIPSGNYTASVRAIATDTTIFADSPLSDPFVIPLQLRPPGKPVVGG